MGLAIDVAADKFRQVPGRFRSEHAAKATEGASLASP
jgi:hypothetical protein